MNALSHSVEVVTVTDKGEVWLRIEGLDAAVRMSPSCAREIAADLLDSARYVLGGDA